MLTSILTSKLQPSNIYHMSDEAFADLKEAMKDALAFERGERRDLKVTRIQRPRPPKTQSPQPIAHLEGRNDCFASSRVLQDNL